MTRHISMLFQGAMIRSLLAGSKTQTRRLKFEGEPGDLIYCREAWHTTKRLDPVKPIDLRKPGGCVTVYYAAGGDASAWFDDDGALELLAQTDHTAFAPGRGRASMHLPKWASRLTLRIKAVRSEPLQDLTPLDAIAEGIHRIGSNIGRDSFQIYDPKTNDLTTGNPVKSYASLWRLISGPNSWDANPIVRVIEFETLRENILLATADATDED